MKRLLTIATAIMLSTSAVAAEKYVFDTSHTNLLWHTGHFGFSTPSGQFATVTGSMMLDKENPSASSVEAMIDINSLWTLSEKFTKHLLSDDFLHASEHPTAKFVSTRVESAADKKSATVTGDLTLNGVTKPVVLDVKLNALGKHPYTQKETAGFSASTVFKRSDFGMSYGIPGVSDEVRITIELEAILEQDANAKIAQ